MRIVRGLLIALCVVAVLLGIVVGAVLSPAGQGVLRDQLTTWASARLGRELHVDGELLLKPGSHLRLSASGLRLANAAWGSEPDMLVATKLVIDLDAWSIFSDTVIVNEISVDGLSLLLERRADGSENWDFDLRPDDDQQGWLASLPMARPQRGGRRDLQVGSFHA